MTREASPSSRFGSYWASPKSAGGPGTDNVSDIIERSVDIVISIPHMRKMRDDRYQGTSADPKAAQTRLLRLLERHRAEWSAFVNSLPERSWIGDIVARL